MTDISLQGRTGASILKIMGLLVVGVSLLLVGYILGWHSSTSADAVSPPVSTLEPLLIQLQPGDPRELLPLPGQGQQEGQGAAPGECPIYLYQDGQLFQLQPGQPLPGQPGFGGGSPELIPLDPAPGLPPSLPVPPPSFETPRYAGMGSFVSVELPFSKVATWQ